MVQLAEGDRTAFDSIFETLWPLVLGYTRRMLNGSAEADDVAQTALMKVFANVSLFDTSKDALTWVLGFATHECMTHRKRVQRRREVFGEVTEATDERMTTEDEAIKNDMLASAQSVLGTLRSEDVNTLQAFLDEHPLSISKVAFRKRLQRAIVRFREAWRTEHEHK